MITAVRKDILFFLSYTKGCVEELGMSEEEAAETSIRLIEKEKDFMVEPYMFDVGKHKRVFENKYPILDNGGPKFYLDYNCNTGKE